MKKNIIAIIPAKKNSTRLNNKNLKNIASKKLIWFSINAALKSKYISRVIVSTDCKKIKSYSEKSGADVPFIRPKKLCSDKTQMLDILRHANKEIINSISKIDAFIILQPTSPLRDYKDIDSAIKFFYKKKADYVTSFSEAMPRDWYFKIGSNKKINYKIINKGKNHNTNYLLNGAIYIYNYKLLKKNFSKKTKCYSFLMPREKSIDIDFKIDFEIANFLLNKKKA